MKHHPLHRRPQRGISLLFALLALVALTVAAVGLVRTVGTGSLVVGNVGFKMDATSAGDRGAEEAITWLRTNMGSALNVDVAASGYYATSKDALDPTGRNTTMSPRAVVDWNDDNCATVSGTYTACLDATARTTIGGNTVNWIITRLCAAAGAKDDASNSCATSISGGVTDNYNSGAKQYGDDLPDESVTEPYYRIVVRTVGARNTVSYTETIVHF